MISSATRLRTMPIRHDQLRGRGPRQALARQCRGEAITHFAVSTWHRNPIT
jgi:hypothetical protein